MTPREISRKFGFPLDVRYLSMTDAEREGVHKAMYSTDGHSVNGEAGWCLSLQYRHKKLISRIVNNKTHHGRNIAPKQHFVTPRNFVEPPQVTELYELEDLFR
jgi:hypothetical protein